MGEAASPFIGTEARAAGRVTRRTLRSRHVMIYRNVYVPAGQRVSAVTRAEAAWLWSRRNATVAGLSAAAFLGSKWIDDELPAELNRPQGCGVDGILIHREALSDEEIRLVRGIPTTSPARTAFDLGRRGRIEEAVMRLDALANATRLQRTEVDAVLGRHPGVRGLSQLRRVIDLMDGGAESPQETRTRLLIVTAGLPRPQTQIVVCDAWNMPFARIDLGWTEWKVGIEYDGPQHWTDPRQRTRDIDRYAELTARGWVIVRVGSDLLRHRPHVVLERVCGALREAGCSWPIECGLESRLRRVRVA